MAEWLRSRTLNTTVGSNPVCVKVPGTYRSSWVAPILLSGKGKSGFPPTQILATVLDPKG
jgi:hypothetical protein